MESSQSSMSRNNSQSNIDPLEGLIDFSEYDTMNFNSPSGSPADIKQQFTQPELPLSRANSILPSNQQTLTGPSHPYDMHKQQTGIPTGGLATTMAINNNYQMYAGNGYLSGVGVSPVEDFVDVKYGSNPSSGSFDSVQMNEYDATPVDPAFFFPPIPTERQSGFVKPSNLTNTDNSMQQPSNVGRLWPGMHQQQAMAKAQQSQRQQHQQRMVQQQRQNSVVQQPQQARSKVRPATDPLVEEKIAQLLSSMRQKSDAGMNDEDADGANSNGNGGRLKKDEEDMDEDERLLASEEGKKLSSKERRQLRNKVSARAFRSRRKGKSTQQTLPEV